MTVVGISFLTYCFARGGIIFLTAVLPFDDPGRTLAGNIFTVTALSDPGLLLRAAYQIRRAFTAQTVSRIIGTNPVNRLHRITVQFGISLVLALLAGVNCIILIIFTKANVAAVFGAEETDGGGLIGFVGLFKLKGGLRFGCVCVCMCRKAGGNS